MGTAVFDEDEEQILNEPVQRKKMRYNVSSTKSAYVRRKPFRDNYLRPINSLSSYKAPKYKITTWDQKKQAKIVQKEEENEKKQENEDQNQRKMITDDVISNEERTGFCFVENTENESNAKQNSLNNEIVAPMVVRARR